MSKLNELTRPIIGIENRTAQEVFDIMCDRIHGAFSISVDEAHAKAKEILKNKPKKFDRNEGRCPECGLPYSQCDPEGVGHYRG